MFKLHARLWLLVVRALLDSMHLASAVRKCENRSDEPSTVPSETSNCQLIKQALGMLRTLI